MAKIAMIRMGWTRSVSRDVTGRRVVVTKNGETTSFEVPSEVSEYVMEVQADSNVTFNTVVYDNEGNEAQSDIYAFTLPDFVAPEPDTDLFHEVLSVRDDL